MLRRFVCLGGVLSRRRRRKQKTIVTLRSVIPHSMLLRFSHNFSILYKTVKGNHELTFRVKGWKEPRLWSESSWVKIEIEIVSRTQNTKSRRRANSCFLCDGLIRLQNPEMTSARRTGSRDDDDRRSDDVSMTHFFVLHSTHHLSSQSQHRAENS